MSSHLGNGKVKNISKEEALLIKELEVGYMPREGEGGIVMKGWGCSSEF